MAMHPHNSPVMGLGSKVLLVLVPAAILVTTTLTVLIYKGLNQSIIDGFDRLLIASSVVTSAFINTESHQALLNERLHQEASAKELSRDPRYLDHIRPMREIRTRLGLTYLFTQVHGQEENEVIYVFDANQDDDHTPIGTPDTLPADAMHGMYQVIGGAPYYISPVQAWEEWGLLKSGFAPIKNRHGDIVAAAGADVNVSVIRARTRVALLTVFLLGLAALSAGLAITWFIAQRLSGAMQALKTLAARTSAGSTTPLNQQMHTVPELAPIAAGIEQLRRELTKAHQEVTAEARNLRKQRATESAHDHAAQQLQGMMQRLHHGYLISLDPKAGLYWLHFTDPAKTLYDATQLRLLVDLAGLFKSLWLAEQQQLNAFSAAARPLLKPGEGALLLMQDDSLRHLAGDVLGDARAAKPVPVLYPGKTLSPVIAWESLCPLRSPAA
ncbi:hypothetical protein [Thiorhodospira sibirica]|uniref:hypothetical protein n=1 Tax=Thiorhodospira sibirica TaxID=154347 RepID=UPI00022C4663|nr:hypothetical protein [Thiorhodospira sibirica]